MFSIIIPLYNKREFIKQSIQSVLDQSYIYFECIIVDDGSTDDSLSLVKEFNDDRLKILSKINGGVSSARNLGIQIAKYNYIAFLDADDYWSPNYLELMTMLINKYPNNGLYFSSHYIVYPKGNVIVKSSPELAAENQSSVFNLFQYFKTYHVCGWTLHTSCCIVDKNIVIEAGGFDERISFYEDYDLFSRIALYTDFVYLNDPLTYYNCDLPADERLTGTRPQISKHWINYIHSGLLSQSKDINVKYLIHNFAVFLLRRYRESEKQIDEVNRISKLINDRFLTLRFMILKYSPVWFLIFLTKRRTNVTNY